jgi:hypothetical protein
MLIEDRQAPYRIALSTSHPSFQRKLESHFLKRWKEKRFQLSLE